MARPRINPGSRTSRPDAGIPAFRGSESDEGRLAVGQQDRREEAQKEDVYKRQALESGDTQADESEDSVQLMTLHSAKGLEFPQVYLVGLEEGLLPHRRSVEAADATIDEERRLCYVGVTRAQDRLTMSLALGRMKWGKPRPSEPSRFLYEITGQKPPPREPARPHGQRPSAARPKTAPPKSAPRPGKRPPR